MKTLQRIVSIGVIVVIFYFLITTLISNWQRIPFGELRFEPLDLLMSFLCLFAYFLLFVLGWRAIMIQLGQPIQFSKAFWVISTSQVAKYVPGGIWYTLGRMYLCKTENMKSKEVLLSVILETCLLLLTNMVLFLISIYIARTATLINPLVALAIIAVLLIFVYPPVLTTLVNVGLKIFKRSLITFTISYARMLTLSLYFIGVWITQIIGFYFLINAMYPLSFSHIFSLAAAYTLSWIIGFIVPFAPGGLGVREGMMTLLLSSVVPTPLAIAVSFITRVWITVFELLTFFIGLLVKKL